MDSFAGKVAVVTGAASGIGRALATRAAHEGMTVVLADVEAPALEVTVDGLRQQELDVLGVVTDVASPESVEDLAREVFERYGKVNLLCNNAGVAGADIGVNLWEAAASDWQWMLGVNLWGVVNGIRYFVPQMLQQGEAAHIVNTASVAGLIPGGLLGIYGVSKHAVVALSEALEAQLRARAAKIRVSVLCPSWVNTRIADAQRNRPDELQGPERGPNLMADLGRQLVERGMPPDDAADLVFRAVAREQFYVLTDPTFDPIIRARMEGILASRL